MTGLDECMLLVTRRSMMGGPCSTSRSCQRAHRRGSTLPPVSASTPEVFFPERTDSNLDFAKARAVCEGCTVRSDCLDYAIDNDEVLGIWGGASRVERRQITRARRRAS